MALPLSQQTAGLQKLDMCSLQKKVLSFLTEVMQDKVISGSQSVGLGATSGSQPKFW